MYTIEERLNGNEKVRTTGSFETRIAANIEVERLVETQCPPGRSFSRVSMESGRIVKVETQNGYAWRVYLESEYHLRLMLTDKGNAELDEYMSECEHQEGEEYWEQFETTADFAHDFMQYLDASR